MSIYAEELKQKKEELEKQLEYEMGMLDFFKKDVRRKEIVVESLQSQIDSIDCELRGEVNK